VKEVVKLLEQMDAMQRLTDIKGLSEAKIEKMVEAAKKLCPAQYGWQSAREVEAQRAKDITKISFGADAVNELLGGGLETKCITEMFGEFRQVAPTLSLQQYIFHVSDSLFFIYNFIIIKK
jgi:hypothetical protein